MRPLRDAKLAPPTGSRLQVVTLGHGVGPPGADGGARSGDRADRYFADDWWSDTKLVRLCLLVLLHERPSYGYELRASLQSIGFDAATAGRVYRALRWLESLALVEPGWEVTTTGPARRVYRLSAAGTDLLEAVGPDVRRRAHHIDVATIRRYLVRRLSRPDRAKRAFGYHIVTTLLVDAADQGAAQRKLERLFGTPGTIRSDIRATGAFELSSAPNNGPGWS